MSIHLFAAWNGTRSIAAVAVVAVAAALITAAVPAHAAPRHSTPMLHEGIGLRAKPSVRVRALQRALEHAGYRVGASGIDGRFGPRTAAAVRRVQALAHLRVDGIVGPRTRKALRSRPALRSRAAQQTRTERRRRSTASRQPATSQPRATSQALPTPAVAPLPLRPEQSSSTGGLVVGALAALIAAFCALGVARRRRRYRARIAQYLCPPSESPQAGHLVATQRLAEAAEPVGAAQPPPVRPVAPAGAKSGLQAGAAVIGYVTVPADVGDGSSRPRERAIERACERAGWRLVDIVHEPAGDQILERPGLSGALERIADGQAQGLLVSDARLLSRAIDFAKLVQWFRDAEAPLIALDLGLDTTTPEGSRMASALITLNGWAGDWIAKRTRGSFSEAQAQNGGGRRPAIRDRPELLARVAAMRAAEMSLQEIADELNAEGVNTPSDDGKWWPSTVQTALRYAARARSARPVDQLPLEHRVT